MQNLIRASSSSIVQHKLMPLVKVAHSSSSSAMAYNHHPQTHLSVWTDVGSVRVHTLRVEFFTEFLDQKRKLLCGLRFLLQEFISQTGDILLNLLQLTYRTHVRYFKIALKHHNDQDNHISYTIFRDKFSANSYLQYITWNVINYHLFYVNADVSDSTRWVLMNVLVNHLHSLHHSLCPLELSVRNAWWDASWFAVCRKSRRRPEMNW